MLVMAAGLVVALGALSLTAGAGEDHRKTTTLVATLAHVTPGSRTVVVEVPLESGILTVGAGTVPDTTITAAGRAAQLEDLLEGSKVRVEFRRVREGDELISLEVLRPPAG
jgi:hypothetical protein